jgi:hypothetical protein
MSGALLIAEWMSSGARMEDGDPVEPLWAAAFHARAEIFALLAAILCAH